LKTGPIRRPLEQSGLVADLDTRQLRERVPAGTLLRPLRRASQPRGEGAVGRPPPTVLLRDKTGSGTALHFYSLGAQTHTEPELGNRSDRNVRTLVNLLNWDRAAINRRLQESGEGASGRQGWQVLAATPNWLTSMASESDTWAETDGSPGAWPAPTPPAPADWRFVFPDQQRQVAAWRAEPQESVLVAILDTCPTQRQLAAAGARYASLNPLWKKVAADADPTAPQRRFFVDEAPSIPREELDAHLRPMFPNWGAQRDQSHADHRLFWMPDHGLFAAGIVRDVAHDAEIHLLRVLNEFGVGDLWSLTTVLAGLPALLRARGKKRLVVNLSLGMDVPPGAAQARFWLPNATRRVAGLLDGARDVRSALGREPDVLALLDDSHGSVRTVLTWLRAELAEGDGERRVDNVLVVAAAGNDNRVGTMSVPPEPRYPARYDDVLGVAAVGSSLAPAEYSNRGDARVIGNGVAVFGGDARRPAPDETPEVTRVPIYGIFGSYTFPREGTLNESGWARWAGTSFATPVIAGLAATYWASLPAPGASARQLIEAVRQFQVPSPAGTNAQSVLDAPPVLARQENLTPLSAFRVPGRAGRAFRATPLGRAKSRLCLLSVSQGGPGALSVSRHEGRAKSRRKPLLYGLAVRQRGRPATGWERSGSGR
ncbi:MAG: S8 family serine peptidase, partial [Chloroflexota bacterium]|nr:S8 family serine peptidase [Chloroflexota bacterium]